MQKKLIKVSILLSFLNIFFLVANENQQKLYSGEQKTIKQYEKEKAYLMLKHYENRYNRLLELHKDSLVSLKDLKEAELNYKISEIDYKIAEINVNLPDR